MFPSYLAACGNSISWLPFTPRVLRIHSLIGVYYTLIAIETISLVLSIVCMCALIFMFCGHQIVHLNLTIMLIFHGGLYSVSAILRLIQIIYEVGWISISSLGCFPIPQIVIVRVTSYISVVLLMGGIIVERAFATHFVIDYEKQKRIWVAAIIVVFLFCLSFFISSQIVMGGINGIIFAATMVAPVCLSLIAFRVLLRRNVKRLGALNDIMARRSAQDNYTLSLRLQLRENIWTMKKLNRLASVITPLCLVCLPFLFMPPLFLRDEENWWILEIIVASNNAVMAAIAPFCSALIVSIFEEVRHMVFPKRRRTEHAKIWLPFFPRIERINSYYTFVAIEEQSTVYEAVRAIRQLLRRNEKRLERLNDTAQRRMSTDIYTLSQRLRLRENIWTMQHLRVTLKRLYRMARITRPLFLIGLLLMFLPPLFLQYEENWWILEIFIAANNALLAAAAPIITAMAAVVFEHIRRVFVPKRFYRENVWLPFSPRIERIHSFTPLYYSFLTIETISLILTFLCLGSVIAAFWRQKLLDVFPFHRSLFCAERAFATYFVIDYERKQRLWIAFIIILPTFAFSIFICSQAMRGAINGIFFSATMLILVIISVITIRHLLKRNEKRLELLNDAVERRYTRDKYTLSLRLQLRENIWTTKRLYPMAKIDTPLCLVCLPLLFLPPLFLQDEENWWILEIFIAGGNRNIHNAALAACAPIISAMVLFVFEQVRRMLIPKVHPVTDVPSIKDAETDQYFDRGTLLSHFKFLDMKSDSLLVKLFPSYLAECGNDTFWLPFSPRIERLSGVECAYYALAVFEIVHRNLTAMLVFDEPGCFPLPQLVILRATAYISIILLMNGIIIERALATYFVNDYEKKRRLWISVTILPMNFVASLMLSSQIIRGEINGVFFGIALLGPVFAAIIIFYLLLNYNERRLARLNDLIEKQRILRFFDRDQGPILAQFASAITREYLDHAGKFCFITVHFQERSLRFPITSQCFFQKLFRMACVVVPICICCVPILAVPAFVLQDKSQWWMLELIIETTNMAIAAVAPLLTAYIIYVFEKVKKLVIPKKWRRRVVDKKKRFGDFATLSERDTFAMKQAISNILVKYFPSYLADCGNETFWLPFSPRLDRIVGYEHIYFILAAFEIIFLLLSFLSMGLLITIFLRHQIVHFNLTAMLVFHGYWYCLMIILRFLQMTFETGLIHLDEPGCFPMPQMVVVRATTYISIIMMMTGVIVERLLATVFVADYEKKRRLWISISLLIVNFALLRILLKHNKERLKRLNDLIDRQRAKFSLQSIGKKDQYSLSLRLQLRENIWTMQKLFRMALFAIPLCGICLPILAVPAVVLQEKSQWSTLELIIEATNMAIAAVAPVFTGYIVYVFEKVRRLIIPKKWRRRAVEKKIRKMTVSVVQASEADQHFDQMNLLFQKSLELKSQELRVYSLHSQLWLPFSPRLERVPQEYQIVYYSLAIFEMICLLLSFFCLCLLMNVFYKHHIVHFNLTSMMIAHGLFICFTILLRYGQIALETNMLPSLSPACSPRPQIIILRLMAYISVLLLMGGILIERALATYFVIDYEKQRRWWISLSLNAIVFLSSFVLSTQIIHGGINGVYFGIVILAPIFMSIWSFRLLLRHNEQRLARLNDMIERHCNVDEYSLSLRLQLDENIWTMQKLYRIAMLSLPICLLCLPFLFLPPFFLRDEENWWILELIIEGNNAGISALAPIFTILVALVFEQVRSLILPDSCTKYTRKVHPSDRLRFPDDSMHWVPFCRCLCVSEAALATLLNIYVLITLWRRRIDSNASTYRIGITVLCISSMGQSFLESFAIVTHQIHDNEYTLILLGPVGFLGEGAFAAWLRPKC
uniref:G protein-coupled receptor n=1 Tax=Pristionchus pacificus TaxID=54126 RepID=A0A8R1YZG8_PRIPA